MFKVISWDDGKVVSNHSSLNAAKRACRKLGCVHSKSQGYIPVAFVSDGNKVFGRWCCVYNPRFRTASFKQIKEYRD